MLMNVAMDEYHYRSSQELRSMEYEDKQPEGYVYSSYGSEKYVKDAIISVLTLRRYDPIRPVALVCSHSHLKLIQNMPVENPFDMIVQMDEEHQSIIGFKHNLHLYMPFQRNLYLDSDMIWCRNPDNVWHALRPFPYTITGQESADVFFGSHKNFGIVFDILLGRRQRTLRRLSLDYLARVQTGVMYAADYAITEQVNRKASEFLDKKDQTHFISRKKEKGRNLESCEWSLGLAVTKLGLFVYPWFNAQESIQLDFIQHLTKRNRNFTSVQCKYYCNPFIHSLRGVNNQLARNFLFLLFGVLPRCRDHMWVTPYVLHFGWRHQKRYYDEFVSNEWEKLTSPVATTDQAD